MLTKTSEFPYSAEIVNDLPSKVMSIKSCPCCSNQLLRQVRHRGLYWFCPNCWQEMPDLPALLANTNRHFLQQLGCKRNRNTST